MNGFRRYSGFDKLTYQIPEQKVDSVKESFSDTERILDLIFSVDSNGWPCNSYATMLSEKTSDEVRQFIQNTLLNGGANIQHVIDNPNVLSDFENLSSDFIARCHRNRFESIEDYETRLQEIMKDDSLKETIDNFHKRLKDVSKSV